MSYEINVSQHGKHYFATHKRSMDYLLQADAKAMLADFRERFPEEEGFKVGMKFMIAHSYPMDMEDDVNEFYKRG